NIYRKYLHQLISTGDIWIGWLKFTSSNFSSKTFNDSSFKLSIKIIGKLYSLSC
ncbi:Uncharacterized protein BM_BM14101, partial [Brugia malayi]|uniref:Bm14101 n=1 Tax=Brugia malayi TaxID=6279 RepID=A0A0K0J093_BRUMA